MKELICEWLLKAIIENWKGEPVKETKKGWDIGNGQNNKPKR